MDYKNYECGNYTIKIIDTNEDHIEMIIPLIEVLDKNEKNLMQILSYDNEKVLIKDFINEKSYFEDTIEGMIIIQIKRNFSNFPEEEYIELLDHFSKICEIIRSQEEVKKLEYTNDVSIIEALIRKECKIPFDHTVYTSHFETFYKKGLVLVENMDTNGKKVLFDYHDDCIIQYDLDGNEILCIDHDRIDSDDFDALYYNHKFSKDQNLIIQYLFDLAISHTYNRLQNMSLLFKNSTKVLYKYNSMIIYTKSDIYIFNIMIMKESKYLILRRNNDIVFTLPISKKPAISDFLFLYNNYKLNHYIADLTAFSIVFDICEYFDILDNSIEIPNEEIFKKMIYANKDIEDPFLLNVKEINEDSVLFHVEYLDTQEEEEDVLFHADWEKDDENTKEFRDLLSLGMSVFNVGDFFPTILKEKIDSALKSNTIPKEKELPKISTIDNIEIYMITEIKDFDRPCKVMEVKRNNEILFSIVYYDYKLLFLEDDKVFDIDKYSNDYYEEYDSSDMEDYIIYMDTSGSDKNALLNFVILNLLQSIDNTIPYIGKED